MNERSRFGGWVTTSILAAAAACGVSCQEATQLLVVVDATPELKARITEVVAWSSTSVTQSEPNTSAVSFGPSGETTASLPFSFGVSPGDADKDARVFVRVRGLGAGGRAELCVETEFQPHQRTLVPFLLEDWCEEPGCSEAPCRKLSPGGCFVDERNLLSAPSLCAPDGGATDAGVSDAGPTDAEAGDADAGEPPEAGAPTDGGDEVDAGPPDSGLHAPRLCGCTEWEVGPEVLISTATAALYGASFSPDRLELYQSLNDSLSWSLYSRRRSSPDSDVFGPPQRMWDLNRCRAFDPTSCVNIRFTTTADGLTAYFGSHRVPFDSLDIVRSVRTSTSVPFTTVERVPRPTRSPSGGTFGIYSAEDLEPWINADGTRMYYATTDDPSNEVNKDFVIFYRQWDPKAGEFDEVEYPVEVRSADERLHGRSPSLSPDELLILFHRTVSTAAPEEYIQFATRPHRDAVFEFQGSFLPELVGEDVRGPFLSADGCELVYTRGSWGNEGWRIMKRRITGPDGGVCDGP